MRLVDQHGDAPAGVLHAGEEKGASVEVVVVVAHDDVAPVRHFLRQEIGTHLVRERDPPQRLAVEPAHLRGLGARGRQAVVEAACQRAGLAVAGAVGVLADLLAGREFEHARPVRAALPQHAQGVQRHGPAGGLGGEEEHLVELVRRARLEQRKERGQRLADAGGRLRQQAAPAHGGAVDRLGQFALAGAEVGVGKLELRQRVVERTAVRGLALCPVAVAGAQRLEVRAQRVAGVLLFEHGFVAAGQVEVDQRDGQLLVSFLLAQHPAVAAHLGPVQRAVVGADGVEVAAEGLDFFHPRLRRVVAVGPAAHAQRAAGGGQRHLALVVAAAPGLHQRVAGHAFERAGRGHEAQVEIARLRAEGAQGLDGHDVRRRDGG
ncbi:hypothetical protein FQZ97_667300 [compost metagenome]